MTTRRRRMKRIGAYIGGAATAVLAVVAVTVVDWPGETDGAGGRNLFELVASRDLGHLPGRGTDGGAFCGAIQGLAAPPHCWPLQQSSGDAVDTGAVGGWDLTPTGTVRAGVATGLPVPGTGNPLDFDSEVGVWVDSSAASHYSKTGVTLSATNLVSVTVVFSGIDGASTQEALVSHRDAIAPSMGYLVFISSSGILAGSVDRGASSRTISSAGSVVGAWHCATLVFDARTTDAGKIYIDGVDDTAISDVGDQTFTSVADFRLLNWANSSAYASASGVARVRIDDGVAVTLAQHKALCGTFAQPVRKAHPIYADTTFTRSGGTSCNRTAAETAICYPGTGAPYVYAPDNVGAPRTNRVLQNTGAYLDCTASSYWTCQGASTMTPGQTAPNGAATATTVAIGAGANQVASTAHAGYTADAPLYMSMSIMCLDTDEWHIHNAAGEAYGDLHVDCDALDLNVWHTVTNDATFISVVNPFVASPGGTAGFHFEDPEGGPTADAKIWAPTLTEESNLVAIPTGSASRTIGQNWPDAYGWAAHGPGAINRARYNTAIDGTNWSVRGMATSVPVVGPDGSKTAFTITVDTFGADDIFLQSSGYTNNAVLYHSIWIKCSTGLFRIQNPGGGGGATGNWYVDCTVINNKWTPVYDASQPGVIEIQSWAASAIGSAGFWFAGQSGTVTASIWLPTETEEKDLYGGVIPTGSAAVDSGVVSWSAANERSRWWSSSATVLNTIDEIDGTCFVTGNPLYFAGSPASEAICASNTYRVQR